MAIEGGCRRNAVRYALDVDALPATCACHCHQCRRWSGSAFSWQAPVDGAALTVTGPIEGYRLTTADRTSHQRFRAVRHAHINNMNTRRPGVAMLRAGTLDRSGDTVCVAHIVTATRQRWFAIPVDVPHRDGAPPPDALIALVRGR